MHHFASSHRTISALPRRLVGERPTASVLPRHSFGWTSSNDSNNANGSHYRANMQVVVGGVGSKEKPKKVLTDSQKKARRRKYAENAKRKKELRAQGLLPPAVPKKKKTAEPRPPPSTPRAKLARQPTLKLSKQFSSSRSKDSFLRRESNRRKALVPYVSRERMLAEIAAKVPPTSSARRKFAMVPYVSRNKLLAEIAAKTAIKPKSKSKSTSKSGPTDYKALSELCNQDLAEREGQIAKLYEEQAKLAKAVRKNLAAIVKNINALTKQFPAEQEE